jgi:hypothetical protein
MHRFQHPRRPLPGARLLLWTGLGIAVSAASVASAARADVLYDVTLNTSALSGITGALTFDFIDGGPPDNSVSISIFTTDGTLGAPSSTGSVTGTVATGLGMTDASFFNEQQQLMTLGTSISFELDATTNLPAPGSLPDTFSLFLLDPTGTSSLVSTSDPTGADSLLTFQINDTTNASGAVVGEMDVYGAGPSLPVTATLHVQTITAAPEIDGTSIGSALTVLIAGLIVLRSRVMARSRDGILGAQP